MKSLETILHAAFTRHIMRWLVTLPGFRATPAINLSLANTERTQLLNFQMINR